MPNLPITNPTRPMNTATVIISSALFVTNVDKALNTPVMMVDACVATADAVCALAPNPRRYENIVLTVVVDKR